MPEPPAPSETGSSSEVGALIFTSDASAEAERLSAALRARGYQVVDVPLGLLVSRVSVQRPALILCDADEPGALESVERIHREVPGGHRVDVVFVREPNSAPAELVAFLEREGSGVFERPVDEQALTRRVETLIGPPARTEHRPRLAPGGRAPILVAASRKPFRYDQRPSSLLPDPPTNPPPGGSVATNASDLAPAPEPSVRPRGEPSDRPRESLPPNTVAMPQSRLSPELEMLLGRAEQRVEQARQSVAPPSDRLSPEQELEAILPTDVLAALDEPLDFDDDEESDAGPSTHGGADERAASRTGTKTTGHGAPAQPAASAGARTPTDAPPEPSVRETEPPRTPPDMPSRAAQRPPSDPPAAVDSAPPPTPPRERSDPPPSSAGTFAPSSRATVPPPLPGAAGPASASTTPPRALRSEPFHAPPLPAPLPSLDPQGELELPSTLRAGDSVRCLARAVRARYTGAIAFEDGSGVRRVAFRDGDFVTAASSSDAESLVACLIERGSLPPDAQQKLGRKLPQFGRHAGAALIAHGYLQQDELWPVLRHHAEWLIGRIARLAEGAVSVERELPQRLATEPAVFGGATGAEVLIEIVRRTTPPELAMQRLGGPETMLALGAAKSLLGECALPEDEAERVRELAGDPLSAVLRGARPDFASALLGLVELGVVDTAAAAREAPPPPRPTDDTLDHEALRSRILARRALVEDGDYFAVLGVSRGATAYDVRRAYSALRQELAPERVLTPATADLRDDVDAILFVLEEAFEILGDDLRRERYRRALEAAPR